MAAARGRPGPAGCSPRRLLLSAVLGLSVAGGGAEDPGETNLTESDDADLLYGDGALPGDGAWEAEAAEAANESLAQAEASAATATTTTATAAPTCAPLPAKVPRAALEAAMAFEAAYAPLDDAALRGRASFQEALWADECTAFDAAGLRQLLVVTRTGRRRPRLPWLRDYVEPLFAQLRSAVAGEGGVAKDLQDWFRYPSKSELLSDWEATREARSSLADLEAQGAGIWAEFFLDHGLPELGAEAALSVLRPWSLEASSAGPAEAEACDAFQRGFVSSTAGLGLQVRLAQEWRAQGRRDDQGARQAARALWPRSADGNSSGLTRRPWCPRFAAAVEESHRARLQALAGLAPSLTEAVRQHTGFEARGNASLGLIFACQALYADDAMAAERALPCRLLGPFLRDLPGHARGDAWRARGDAARWVAHGALLRLAETLYGAANAADQGEAPKLRVWCTDAVLVSSLVASLGALEPSEEPPPAVLSPAASRLVLAVTASGALCAEYNGRPLAVAASADAWVERLTARLAAAGPEGEALCRETAGSVTATK